MADRRIIPFSKTELTDFWEIIQMSYRHDRLKHIVSSKNFSDKISSCPMLVEKENLKYLEQSALFYIIMYLKEFCTDDNSGIQQQNKRSRV